MSKVLTITFRNDVDDDLVIGYDTDYGIIGLEGFGADCIDIETEEYQFDGGHVTKVRVGSRTLTIEFDYHGWSDSIPNQMYRFFTPFKAGRMIVNNEGLYRAIDYTVSSFKSTHDNMYKNPVFELELFCPSGYFEDSEYTTEALELWSGGWQHQWSGSFQLRQRGSGVVTIENDGHVDAPVQVMFKGPASQPKVLNLTTGTEFGLKSDLDASETLIIETDKAIPTVTITNTKGEVTNGFPYVTVASDFEFGMALGSNRLKYASANSNQLNEVHVMYKRRYLGAF